MTSEFKNRLKNYGIEGPDSFPEGTESAIKRGIGFWYKGEIEFVDIKESPDLRIVAFQGGYTGGFSTFPRHDELNDSGEIISVPPDFSPPLIGVNMDAMRRAYEHYKVKYGTSLFDEIQDIITHEFGHTIGILHTRGTLNELEKDQANSCSPSEIEELTPIFSNSHMKPISAGVDLEGSEIDSIYREVIGAGIPKF